MAPHFTRQLFPTTATPHIITWEWTPAAQIQFTFPYMQSSLVSGAQQNANESLQHHRLGGCLLLFFCTWCPQQLSERRALASHTNIQPAQKAHAR